MFKYRDWSYYKKEEGERDEIELLDEIYKSEGYRIISDREHIKREDIGMITTTKYYIKDMNLEEIQ